jgi:hypothetical protein
METDYLVKPGDWMMENHQGRADQPSPEDLLQDNLCKLGQSGWDLVAVTPDARRGGLWIFKKPALKRVTQRSFNAGEYGETQT